MVILNTLLEVEQVLYEYIIRGKDLLGKDLTLVRMAPLMSKLGNPQNKLKIIHIAGTSGKTSTAYYISSLIYQSGKKVGLTVSPHIDSITERVQINTKPISEKEFCQSISEFLHLIKEVEPVPSYFELIIAYVYWYFYKAGVDYAVIETGLGGKFDATNVARSSNKVCVITDIGIDHTHVLGKTLRKIAGQKAGIIHANNQVFMYKQSKTIMEVVQNRVDEVEARLSVLSNNKMWREVDDTQFKNLPEFQKRNWFLAFRVYKSLTEHNVLPVLNDQQLINSICEYVPGRMDIIKVNGKTIIMDGAHNEQKMSAFLTSYLKIYPHKKAAVMLSLKEGKEYESVLPLLKQICSKLIITTFPKPQFSPIKFIEPTRLLREAKKLGMQNVLIEPNYHAAYRLLTQQDEDIAVVTGSFYLISSVRSLIA